LCICSKSRKDKKYYDKKVFNKHDDSWFLNYAAKIIEINFSYTVTK
jgi:hypothetical protein